MMRGTPSRDSYHFYCGGRRNYSHSQQCSKLTGATQKRFSVLPDVKDFVLQHAPLFSGTTRCEKSLTIAGTVGHERVYAGVM